MARNIDNDLNRTGAVAPVITWLALRAMPLFGAPASPSRVELAEGWRLASASNVQADGSAVSQPGFADSAWHPIRRMPATVLEILQEDGVYTDLYVGKNLLEKVPQDLVWSIYPH